MSCRLHQRVTGLEWGVGWFFFHFQKLRILTFHRAKFHVKRTILNFDGVFEWGVSSPSRAPDQSALGVILRLGYSSSLYTRTCCSWDNIYTSSLGYCKALDQSALGGIFSPLRSSSHIYMIAVFLSRSWIFTCRSKLKLCFIYTLHIWQWGIFSYI